MTAEPGRNTRLVVDVSVAVKWFMDEVQSPQARNLLSAGTHLVAPDVFVAELGNALLKKARGGEMLPEDVPEAIARTELVVDLEPALPLAPSAFEIAMRYQRSFYDALYVALAIREGIRLVTGDMKLINGMGESFRDVVLPLSEV